MKIQYWNYSRFRNVVELIVDNISEMVPMYEGDMPTKNLSSYYALHAAVVRARKCQFGEKVLIHVPNKAHRYLFSELAFQCPTSKVVDMIKAELKLVPGIVAFLEKED